MEAILFILLIGLLLVWMIERLNGAEQRAQIYPVEFNGERLTGACLVIDRRTPAQRRRNEAQGCLDGDLLVFMHGHGQPPQYGYNFTSLLAERSRSGIVVIPCVHTPFGQDPVWRGDQGKTRILMALVRQALAPLGIQVKAAESESGPSPVLHGVPASLPVTPCVEARIAVVGWSHGGILARRFANAYPSVVSGLGQITPAGFESWGRGTFALFYLMVNFIWESILIGSRLFHGEARHILVAGWALARGISGDMLAAWRSLLSGRLLWARLFRPLFDVYQCSLLMTDDNMPVPAVERVAVLFGRTDSVFEAGNAIPLASTRAAGQAEVERFFQTFYPHAYERGAHCTFKILPGNHIGPLVHAELYAHELLQALGELRPAELAAPLAQPVTTSS